MDCTMTNEEYQKYRNAQLNTQIEYERQRCLADIEISKAAWKANVAEEQRLAYYKKRLEMREAQKIREKAQVEELQVSDSGDIAIVTRNIAIKTDPCLATNLKSPKLGIYYSQETDDPPCYRVSFIDGTGEENAVFLDSELIAKPSYLLRKLTGAGIYFYVPISRVMPLFIALIVRLAENCEKVY